MEPHGRQRVAKYGPEGRLAGSLLPGVTMALCLCGPDYRHLPKNPHRNGQGQAGYQHRDVPFLQVPHAYPILTTQVLGCPHPTGFEMS